MLLLNVEMLCVVICVIQCFCITRSAILIYSLQSHFTTHLPTPSESFSSSSDTDYDEISSSLSRSSKSSSEESVAPGVKVPRMDKLVSILPAQVVQRLRSQKWRNWITKVIKPAIFLYFLLW